MKGLPAIFGILQKDDLKMCFWIIQFNSIQFGYIKYIFESSIDLGLLTPKFTKSRVYKSSKVYFYYRLKNILLIWIVFPYINF